MNFGEIVIDVVGKAVRSRMMSGIRGKDTKPEMLLRNHLHRLGFRYRLHEKNLSGRPDLYFPRYKAAIFVNGCFWHRHHCSYFKWPSTRPDFWKEKLEGNAIRDAKKLDDLSHLGIKTLTIWECAIRDKTENELNIVVNQVANWLRSEETVVEISG